MGALPRVRCRGGQRTPRPGRAHRRSCWCSGLSAAAPSGASPSACGSRPSSRTSRRCCRPAPPRRSTGRSRPGSGASSRTSGVDQATIWALDDRSGEARLTHSWIREGVPAPPTVVRESEVPRIFSRLRQGHVIRLPQPGGPPDEALIDRQSLARFGTRSSAVVPLIEGSSVVGGLSVGTVRAQHRWPDELVTRLRLLADVFANALARQYSEQAERASAAHIRDLAGRLITAQEEERRRIAGEHHDDVSQDLAALSLALSALGQGPSRVTVSDLGPEGGATARGAPSTRANAVRLLSHELHPGVLQYAGARRGPSQPLSQLRARARPRRRVPGKRRSRKRARSRHRALPLPGDPGGPRQRRPARRRPRGRVTWQSGRAPTSCSRSRDDGRGAISPAARARGGLGPDQPGRAGPPDQGRAHGRREAAGAAPPCASACRSERARDAASDGSAGR